MININASNSAILITIILATVSAFAVAQSKAWLDTDALNTPDDNEQPVSFTRIGQREEKPLKIREGQIIKDEKARIKISGSRYLLYRSNNERPLVVLENLALERVVEYLSKSGPDSTWLVHGTITEYQGSNYVLLTRAHVNSLAESTESRPR